MKRTFNPPRASLRASLREYPDRYVEKFDQLAALPNNWDSYGAIPPLGNCLAKARQLAPLLPGDWSVVPCSDGGVQLELHAGGLDIEITISNADRAPAHADPTGKTREPPHCPTCGCGAVAAPLPEVVPARVYAQSDELLNPP